MPFYVVSLSLHAQLQFPLKQATQKIRTFVSPIFDCLVLRVEVNSQIISREGGPGAIGRVCHRPRRGVELCRGGRGFLTLIAARAELLLGHLLENLLGVRPDLHERPRPDQLLDLLPVPAEPQNALQEQPVLLGGPPPAALLAVPNRPPALLRGEPHCKSRIIDCSCRRRSVAHPPRRAR